MANTGYYLVIQFTKKGSSGDSTGQTKPNQDGDDDYIPPTLNLGLCPVVYDLSCPTDYGYTFSSGTLWHEMSIPFSVFNNPAVTIVRVQALLFGSPTGTPQNFTLSSMANNFFSSTFTGIGAGTHGVRVTYLDAGSSVVATCNL